MNLVNVVATRSTCVRRKVGCVLVDWHKNVVATGYNGVPRGTDHCIDCPCPGAQSKSGTNLDMCRSIHAEANALMQCSNVNDARTAYVTASPCVHCARMLLNSGVKHVIYGVEYPHPEAFFEWQGTGRLWTCKTLKPMVVGEAPGGKKNARSGDSTLAGAVGSGLRLRNLSGLTHDEWVSGWVRINLCRNEWDPRKAQEKADYLRRDMFRGRPAIVLLGAKVARAFGYEFKPFCSIVVAGTTVYTIPHPSGLCRYWNDPDYVKMGEDVMGGITREWVL